MNPNLIRRVPTVALRGIVMFPNELLHFDVGREKSINAVKKALDDNEHIFLVTQKSISQDDPKTDDLYTVGVLAKVEQILRAPGKTKYIHLSVFGLKRARLENLVDNGRMLYSDVIELENEEVLAADEKFSVALMRQAKDLFSAYSDLAPRIPEDIISKVIEMKDPGRLADFIAANIMLEFEDRQRILENLNPLQRLMAICEILANETQLLAIEMEISDKVQEKIDKNQKDYYLNEQLKAITEELNGFSQDDDIASYRKSIDSMKASEEVKTKLLKECARLEKMSPASSDAAVARTYIEVCLELPWGKYSKENQDIMKSKAILDKDHYGLEKVKERIIEHLAVSTISSEIKGQIISLVGPPGVGKTSVARSVARATGRKFVRIALGGVKDEAEIRGHRRTYIGSMPGRIIDAVRKSGTSNPVILLDEIDKLSSDYKGDPTSALLEVLDPEQNHTFTDHYIDLPYDLSRVLFITTANIRTDIPMPLQDRMEIIELSSYTFEEKFNIAKRHLIKKQVKKHGLNGNKIRFTDKAIKLIIEGYTREAGVRLLEQKIAAICRKTAALIVEGEIERIVVKPENLERFLGSRKYKEDEIRRGSEVGVATGLAWTSVGGEMLEIESAVLDGTGKIELTGSIGDIMQESAKTAVSFIRSKSKELEINSEFYKTNDIHIHFPEGATPKDGPSAGVTIATSLVSALTGKKVRDDVAMTGEITLRGRVLPIGGLKEKSMAAYRAGIKKVIIPEGNKSDLDEIDAKVKENITFIPVKTVDQVWHEAVIGLN